MNNIKKLIKSEFEKRNSRPGHSILLNQFVNNIYNKLNPKEQSPINPAIQELVDEGFITIEDKNGQSMVLSEEAYMEIYPISEFDTISKIQRMILNKFRDTNSKVGHYIPNRWINLSLMQELNPREKNYVNIALQQLIDKEFIEVKESGGGVDLFLLKNGYDKIY